MRTETIDALVVYASANPDVMLLTADLGYSVLERFAEALPAQYANVGVCEQAMAGISAGLALSGRRVVIYSIANFPTLRCLEHLRHDVCYHDLPVTVIAVGGGLAYGAQGYTHHGVEDLGIMSMLPNMAVTCPADPHEAVTLLPAPRTPPSGLSASWPAGGTRPSRAHHRHRLGPRDVAAPRHGYCAARDRAYPRSHHPGGGQPPAAASRPAW